MARPARKYKYKLDVSTIVNNADGFGGNVTSSQYFGQVWADLVTVNADKLNDFGLDIIQDAYLIYVRKNSIIDWYSNNYMFTYDGVDYIPVRVTEKTIGVEFEILVSGRES